MSLRPMLIAKDGDWSMNLAEGINVVGRNRTASNIWLDHPSVSKLHCLIVERNGQYLIRDLDSTNATTVNGMPVNECSLRVGDYIGFGPNVVARFVSGETETTMDRDETEPVSVRMHHV